MKQYNPVKVKNPSTDGYAIRLHPRQSIELTLNRIFEDEEFEIKLISDYLVLDERTYDVEASKEIYHFVQKYDLERWSDISTMFLGNIVLTIKPLKETDKEIETIRMCVFLNSSNKDKANVVTVVDPKNQVLKIEPNQIVQVVLPDNHYAKWILVGIESLGMECARTETVFNDVSNVYDPLALFCPEPRDIEMPANPTLTDVESQYIKTYRSKKEFHFWTHLSLASLRKSNVSSKSSSLFSMGEMIFACKSDDGTVLGERSFEIVIALRGHNRVTAAEFQKIRDNTRNWNEIYSSSLRRCVISPTFNESIDLSADADSLYVEIPEPSVYFPKLSDEVYWGHEINMGSKYGLTVKELTPRYVNYRMIQRFMIVGIVTARPPGDLLFIGALRFICKGDKSFSSDNKNINVSLWKVLGIAGDKRSRIAATSTTTTSKTQHQTSSVTQHQTFDVELEQMMSDLSDGLKTVTLDSIEVKKFVSYGPYCGAYSSYDFDDDDLMSCSVNSKKKTRSAIGTDFTARSQSHLLGNEKQQKETWEEADELTTNWHDLI